MYIGTSKEEGIAFEIYQILHKNFGDLITDKLFLENFHFEIINDFYNKNVFFSYVLKNDTDIKKIELYLMGMDIVSKFIDKSSIDKKRYLAVWK